MSKKDWSAHEFETAAVRAGQQRTDMGEQSEPIFLTSSFTFTSAAQAAARFMGADEGNVYSRFTNPTVTMFQDKLAAMEGAQACVATASGMSAILSTCLALLSQGDEIACSRSVFGSTTTLFNKYLTRYGIQTQWVAQTDCAAWKAAITDKTKIFYLESPSNPLTEIADIQAIADIAHENNILLVVDNCFCTPALQQPLALGADIIIHSATKYLDGQGRGLGGAVLGSTQLVDEEVFGFLRAAGPSMSPFNAWMFIKGLETLPLRMQAHSSNALALAQWLETHPKVSHVYYPGLPSHPQHTLASQQQTAFGGIVSFEVVGGQAQAWQLIDATKLISITGNLGDAKSTITHPATTTHAKLNDEQRALAGIKQNLIRIAVGLEHIDDIKADIEAGLAQIKN